MADFLYGFLILSDLLSQLFQKHCILAIFFVLSPKAEAVVGEEALEEDVLEVVAMPAAVAKVAIHRDHWMAALHGEDSWWTLTSSPQEQTACCSTSPGRQRQ